MANRRRLIELVITSDTYIAAQREIERAIASLDFSKPQSVTVFVDGDGPGSWHWWAQVSDADAQAALEKAAEYGSLDLRIMGAAMKGGVEEALAFYALGKVARAISALQRGDAPSDDTWRDLVTYGMMARRFRERGDWP